MSVAAAQTHRQPMYASMHSVTTATTATSSAGSSSSNAGMGAAAFATGSNGSTAGYGQLNAAGLPSPPSSATNFDDGPGRANRRNASLLFDRDGGGSSSNGARGRESNRNTNRYSVTALYSMAAEQDTEIEDELARGACTVHSDRAILRTAWLKSGALFYYIYSSKTSTRSKGPHLEPVQEELCPRARRALPRLAHSPADPERGWEQRVKDPFVIASSHSR